MTQRPLIVFGLGELADVAAFYFEHDGGRRVAAFSADADRIKESTFLGRPAVALSDLAAQFPPGECDAFVAIGYSKVNALRQQKCDALRALGYDLTSYVSPRATTFPTLRHGWNCFVLEDNTVQPFATIGNGVTLWSGNHIGHHSHIGDFVFISSHVVVSGGVRIGARTFVGVNSTLNDHISVGARCVIGSGCLVAKDLPDESVLSAEPAKLSPVPSSRLRGF